MTAYVDESIRPGGVYILAAALVCRCRSHTVRREMRALLRTGQRRVHFAKASDRERRQALSVITSLEVPIAYARSRGSEVDARSGCWAALVPLLLDRRVENLVIDRLDGAEQRDRRDIASALKGQTADFAYAHAQNATEPALWVADAAAWAIGKGGPWRPRITRVVDG